MRVCVPTVDERGLEANLSPHFGRAPFYTIVDEANGGVEAVRNGVAVHEHGGCAPTGMLATLQLDAVICRGLGRGAHARLRAAGVRVYLTEAQDVAGALASWRAGELPEVVSEQLCHGHGHGHDQGHIH